MVKQIYGQYIRRFFIHPLSLEAQLPQAEVFVVIPSYHEPDLFITIESLNQAQPPEAKTIVLVVLNHRADDSDEIQEFTQHQAVQLEGYQFTSPQLSLHYIYASDLEGKNAGVGLARKIGMDAVIHSALQQETNPVLICLDADCLVAENYFQVLEQQFLNTDAEVAVLEFLHQRPDNLHPNLATGIDQYELFLEYYRLGLKSAGYPFHFHTVGSSMACKAIPYAKSGGMNQRKAGEDFYFLHKLFPFYKTVSLQGPLVFPSPRISDRVPFGTGRFQSGWVKENEAEYQSYHPDVFRLLQLFLNAAFRATETTDEVELTHFEDFRLAHSESTQFLINENVLHRLHLVRKSSPKSDTRMNAFFQWFDGFQVLKFVHHFRNFYADTPVTQACAMLLPSLGGQSGAYQVRAIRQLLLPESSVSI